MTLRPSPSSIADSPARTPVKVMTVNHYTKPDVRGDKVHMRLGKTTFGALEMQVMNEGGENNLHSHVGNDGFWYVIKGRARFYTTEDQFVVEIGENEGFATPRGYKYWFESVPGGDDLELMRFGASTFPQTGVRGEDGRVNHEDLKPNQESLVSQKEHLAFEPLEAKF